MEMVSGRMLKTGIIFKLGPADRSGPGGQLLFQLPKSEATATYHHFIYVTTNPVTTEQRNNAQTCMLLLKKNVFLTSFLSSGVVCCCLFFFNPCHTNVIFAKLMSSYIVS
jgi:hypothetical protein